MRGGEAQAKIWEGEGTRGVWRGLTDCREGRWRQKVGEGRREGGQGPRDSAGGASRLEGAQSAVEQPASGGGAARRSLAVKGGALSR